MHSYLAIEFETDVFPLHNNNNLSHNILELYNVLVQVSLAKSKTKLDIQYNKLYERVGSRIENQGKKVTRNQLFSKKCNTPSQRNSFQTCLYCVYLIKLYDNSNIIPLTNGLTSICTEIILRMVFTCNVKANVKGLEEVEKLGRNECTLPY